MFHEHSIRPVQGLSQDTNMLLSVEIFKVFTFQKLNLLNDYIAVLL